MKKTLLISTLAIAACSIIAFAGQHAVKKFQVDGVKKAATVKTLKSVNKVDEEEGEDKNYEILVQEDFAKFTAGSENAPDATDVTDAETGYIADEMTVVPGWSGEGVFQAGGCAFLGMLYEGTDDETTGYISTPTFDGSGNGGDIRISFRARTAEAGSTDAVEVVSIDEDEIDDTNPMAGVVDYDQVTINDQWAYYEIELQSGAANAFAQLYAYESEIFIDDITVAQVVKNVVPVPVALAATNVTPTSFTANWEAVEGADNYLLNVFSLETVSSGVEEATVTEGFDGIVASDKKGKFIDTEKSTFPEGWTISVSENGTSREIYTSNGNYNSEKVALAFDATGDYIETPEAPAPIKSFEFWTKSQGAVTGSRITVDGFNGEDWINLGYLDFGEVDANFANFVGMDVDDEGIVKLRLSYTKESGNCSIDDFSYTYGGDITKINYVLEDKLVEGTSYDVTGLTEGQQYYYYVTAVQGNDFSEESNIITVGESGVANVEAANARIAATAEGVEISLDKAAPVAVYSADGCLVYNAASGALNHTVALSQHGVYVVKIGSTATKIAR